MSKKVENVRFEGKVVDLVPGKFTVEIAGAGKVFNVFAKLGRKIMKNRIEVVKGDNVEIEISPYDIHNLQNGKANGIISKRC